MTADSQDQERFLEDFFRIFEPLTRWAPGDDATTLAIFESLPGTPETILDVGCGPGASTLVLAENSPAAIAAVDNHLPALQRLADRVAKTSASAQVSPVCADMAQLPFAAASFDLIWSEGSAYVMGFANALDAWRALLKPDGLLVVSELVWRVSEPSPDIRDFWATEYPDMASLQQREADIAAAGYTILDSSPLTRQAWDAYRLPLAQSLAALESELASSPVPAMIRRELDVFERGLGEFGYQFFVLSVAA